MYNKAWKKHQLEISRSAPAFGLCRPGTGAAMYSEK